MTIKDVFTISGCGTVVTGIIEEGIVKKNDTMRYIRADGTTKNVKICDIESFHRIIDSASAGMGVGLLVEDLTKEDVTPGDLLMNP